MMDIKELLTVDLKSSMKNQDKVRTKVIRMVLSSIKLAEIEKGDNLDSARLLSILQKEIKTREETIEEAKKADRPEMIISLDKEIEVIKEYLPKELDDQELEKIVDDIISKSNAESIKQMGLVMKESIAEVAGRASNDRISKLIKEKLS
jgi:hypothetical protein